MATFKILSMEFFRTMDPTLNTLKVDRLSPARLIVLALSFHSAQLRGPFTFQLNVIFSETSPVNPAGTEVATFPSKVDTTHITIFLLFNALLEARGPSNNLFIPTV